MSGYECLLCEGQNGPVTIITTSLVTGATASSCSACYPVALVGALATELGVDGNRLYDAVQRFTQREEKAGRLSPGPADAPPAAEDGRDPNTEYGQDDADQLNALIGGSDDAG